MWIFLIVVVVGLIAGYALIPKPTDPGSNKIEAPTAEEGRSIPVVFGTKVVKGPNLVWYGNANVKKIDDPKAYTYYLDFHMVICHAPLDSILDIIVADKSLELHINDGLLLPITATIEASGDYAISSIYAFGGYDREGGISGPFTYLDGNDLQAVNTKLATAIGDPSVPAFRGVASIAAFNMYIGTTAYMKDWAFLVRRINRSWLPYKAAIVSVPDDVLYTDLTIAGVDAGTTYASGILIVGSYTAQDVIVISRPASPVFAGWSKWSSDGDPLAGGLPWSNEFQVTTDIFQTRSYFTKWYPTATDASNDLKDSVVYLTGSSTYTIWLSDSAPAGNRGGLSLRISKASNLRNAGTIDMNPAHIIRECLTNTIWGMGYTDSDIDDTSFTSAANTLYDERMGMSLVWDTEATIEDFISNVCKHINASIYVNRQSGKFVLKLIRQDYSLIPSFTTSNVSAVSDYQRIQFGELTNAVTVQYWDAVLRNTATVTVQDIAAISMQGVQISTTVKYDGFTNSKLASKVAQRDLKALSTPLVSCTVYANLDAQSLGIGDCFTLTWPDYQINAMVMRVTGIGYGDGKSNRVRITCVQDVFAMPSLALIAPAPPAGQPAVQKAAAVAYRLPYEVGYLQAYKAMGAGAVAALTSGMPSASLVGIAGVKPQSAAIKAQVWANDGSGYRNAGDMFFCASALINADMGWLDTTVAIISFTGDVPVAGTWLQIDSELMEFVSLVSGTLTVRRGLLDTSPRRHTSGARVFFWESVAFADSRSYPGSTTVNLKLLTSTSSDALALSAAPEDALLTNGRLARPYPAGDFKINGSYFPASVNFLGDANLVFSWARRNRLTQLAKPYVGFLTGTVTPEDSTTYVVRGVDPYTGYQVWESAPTSGTGLTYNANTFSIDISPTAVLHLVSLRGGLECFQDVITDIVTTNRTLWIPTTELSPNIWFKETTALTLSGSSISIAVENGSSYSYVQGTSTRRPTAVNSGLNGMRVYRFDGVDDLLVGPTSGTSKTFLNGASEAWAVAVYKSSTSDVTSRFLLSTMTTSFSTMFSMVASSNVGGSWQNRSGCGGRSLAADSYSEMRDGTNVSTNWTISLVRVKFTTKQGLVNVNGNTVTTATLTNMTAGVVDSAIKFAPSFGANNDVTNPFGGDVAELMMGVGTLTNAQVDKLTGYLAYKWKLQTLLPSSHPYRYLPPLVPYVP